MRRRPVAEPLAPTALDCALKRSPGGVLNRHTMNKFVTTLSCAAALLSAQAVGAADATPRDQHAARCVAALEVHTETLAQQVKSGAESARPLLLERLVSGAAFIGDTYLHGNSDEKQARELTHDALEAQKSLPPAELAARQAACADEGARLYAAANVVQQAVIRHFAKKRMDRLLGA